MVTMCDIPLIALLTDFGTSDTFFHGRNIFAPAAAHLACGVNGSDFVPEVRDPVRLPNEMIVPWVGSYSEVQFRGCVVLLGSSGLLEIVAYRQSAESILGLKRGDIVIMEAFGGK